SAVSALHCIFGHANNACCRGYRFQTPLPSAAALDRFEIRHHLNMTKLAGHAAKSFINTTVDNDAAAYAGTERKAYCILETNAGAAPHFSKGGNIRIVIYLNGFV